MRTTVWFASGAVGVALVLSHSLAAAAGARLFYDAPEGCPSQAAFVAAVEARGASFAAGAPSGEARLLTVTLRREESGFSGTLELRAGSQTSEPRAVRGASCAEVSDALAVVTAIALQTDAQAEVVADSGTAPTPPSLPSAGEPVVSFAPTLPAADTEPSAQPHPVHLVLRPDSVSVSAGKLVFDYVVGYTLTGGVALGVVPNLTLPRFDFRMSRANFVKTPGDENYLFGSMLQLGWSFLGVSTYQSPGFSTQIWGLKAGVGMCTPMLYDPQGVILKACSEFAAGVMALYTRDAAGTKTQEKTVGIGTASLELAAQYNLGSLLHLEARLAGEMWLTKLTAERPDGSQIFHSSMFNAYAMLGLGLHF